MLHNQLRATKVVLFLIITALSDINKYHDILIFSNETVQYIAVLPIQIKVEFNYLNLIEHYGDCLFIISIKNICIYLHYKDLISDKKLYSILQ